LSYEFIVENKIPAPKKSKGHQSIKAKKMKGKKVGLKIGLEKMLMIIVMVIDLDLK